VESSFLNPQKAVGQASLEEGSTIADFNAGAGFFARAAARAVGESGVVWAVDAHREMLPRLKALATAEGLHNIEVVHGNVERLHGTHLPQEHFDFVIAANLLFMLEHRDALAREAYRVLRKGGRALVIDWKESFGGLGPHPSHVVSAQDARMAFEAEGFVREKEIDAGAYHWGLVFRKKS
jgi:ubiquinone/menaquinone biosynthesis C-methylase UbiE